MQDNLFKLFKNSIEKVRVKSQPRGTYEPETPVFNVELDAIVKRRTGLAEAVSESEDYSNNTSIHFKTSDAQYVAIGNYIQVDGLWHSIIEIKNGKDFDQGKVKFIRVVIGNDILNEPDDPNWNQVVSA